MAFTKEELKYKDYTWTVDTGDSPKYIGKLDRIKLDRQEGYEVLSFANAFADKYLLFPDKDDLHKIEDMLRKTVPSVMVMKTDIAKFMNDEW